MVFVRFVAAAVLHPRIVTMKNGCDSGGVARQRQQLHLRLRQQQQQMIFIAMCNWQLLKIFSFNLIFAAIPAALYA